MTEVGYIAENRAEGTDGKWKIIKKVFKMTKFEYKTTKFEFPI